jgi:hypothetical protein
MSPVKLFFDNGLVAVCGWDSWEGSHLTDARVPADSPAIPPDRVDSPHPGQRAGPFDPNLLFPSAAGGVSKKRLWLLFACVLAVAALVGLAEESAWATKCTPKSADAGPNDPNNRAVMAVDIVPTLLGQLGRRNKKPGSTRSRVFSIRATARRCAGGRDRYGYLRTRSGARHCIATSTSAMKLVRTFPSMATFPP